MKKFIAIYHSTPEAMAEFANLTPEQAAEGMKAWMAWNQRCGDAIVDLGAPFLPGQSLDTAGNWRAASSVIGGYSIVQGESEAAVKALFDGHPHLADGSGSTIELREFAPM